MTSLAAKDLYIFRQKKVDRLIGLNLQRKRKNNVKLGFTPSVLQCADQIGPLQLEQYRLYVQITPSWKAKDCVSLQTNHNLILNKKRAPSFSLFSISR